MKLFGDEKTPLGGFAKAAAALPDDSDDDLHALAALLDGFATDRDKLVSAGELLFETGKFRGCAFAMRKLLDRFAGDPRGLALLARASRRARDWGTAARAAEELVRSRPAEEFLEIAAQARMQLREWSTALRRYRALHAMSAVRGRNANDMLHALMCAGAWDELAALAAQVLVQEPDSEAVLIHLLRGLIRTAAPAGTRAHWVALARMNPNAAIRWAHALVNQGRFAFAAQAMLGLIEGCGPSFKNVDGRNRLVGALLRRGERALEQHRRQTALDAFAAALIVDPELEQARRGIRAALQLSESGAAATAPPAAVPSPATPRADRQHLLGAADAAQQAGDFETAADRFSQMLVANPADAGARHGLLNVLQSANDPLLAIRVWHALQNVGGMTEEAGRQTAAWVRRALSAIEANTKAGDLTGAMADTKALLAIVPADDQVARRLTTIAHRLVGEARAALKEGRYGDAVRLLENVPVEKRSPDAMRVLARSHWSLGDYPQSLENWTQSAALEPDNRPAWLYISRCCKFLKRYEQGLDAAQRGLKLDPDKQELRDHISFFTARLHSQA